MATSDAELRTRVKRLWAGRRPEESAEWLADRAAVRAIVAKLPTHNDDLTECMWTPELRAMLQRMKGWDG